MLNACLIEVMYVVLASSSLMNMARDVSDCQ